MIKNEVKVGDILSETQFYTVTGVKDGRVNLNTDKGEGITVDTSYAHNLLHSASDFSEVKKVTRTDLAEIFISHSRMAMTVNYNKQVKPDDVASNIAELHGDLTLGMTQADFKKKVKKALTLKGEERTMVGRHYGSPDINGRVHFIDMEIERDAEKEYDTRQRLVDPRTLNYVIVDNVKWQAK